MHVVGGLVRIDADEGRLDLVDGFVESLEAHAVELGGKEFLELRVEVLPEGEGSPDQVLPHARLRLVDGQRRAAEQRGSVELLLGTQFIQGVTRLMHGAEQHGGRVVLLEAGRDAHIVDAETGAERMRRAVLAALGPVVAELGGNAHAEGVHLLFVVLAVQEVILHLFGGSDLLEQLDLLGAQVLEDDLDVGGLHPRLEVIQQGVVGMLGRREEGDVPLGEFYHLFEMRAEDGEFRFLTGFHPGIEGFGGDDGRLDHELGRDALGLFVIAGRDADQRRIVIGGIDTCKLGLEVFEQPSNLVRSELDLRQFAQRTELVPAGFGAALRHVGLLVPAEDRARIAQVGHLAQDLFELVQFLAHGSPRKWEGHEQCPDFIVLKNSLHPTQEGLGYSLALGRGSDKKHPQISQNGRTCSENRRNLRHLWMNLI